MKVYFKKDKDRFFSSGRVSDYLGYKGIELKKRQTGIYKENSHADITQGAYNKRGTDR